MRKASRLIRPGVFACYLMMIVISSLTGSSVSGCGGSSGGSFPLCSLDEYTPNYSDRIYFVHWSSFPVRVYFVRDEHYKPELEQYALTGFNQWVSATDNLISYRIVADRNTAQITVQFDPSTSQGLTSVEYTTGSRRLRTAEINIGIRTGDPVDYQTIAAHEFGHALGIVGIADNPNYPGHSDVNADLMFPSYTKGTPKFVTERDLNTMKTAYCWLFEARAAPVSRSEGDLRRLTIECGVESGK